MNCRGFGKFQENLENVLYNLVSSVSMYIYKIVLGVVIKNIHPGYL